MEKEKKETKGIVTADYYLKLQVTEMEDEIQNIENCLLN